MNIVKESLAKLLAQEDLIVETRNVESAQFNVETRVLTLPNWKHTSTEVVDSLIAHEVGHALYTPNEWDFLDEVPIAFVNVTEDIRIEKLMKRRYEGIAKTFYKGYKKLEEEDFCNIKGSGVDVGTLSLQDKLNIHYKIGNFVKVPFNDEETPFLAKCDALETFEDAINLAKELLAYSKQQFEKLQEMNAKEEEGLGVVPQEEGQSTIPDFPEGEDLSEGKSEKVNADAEKNTSKPEVKDAPPENSSTGQAGRNTSEPQEFKPTVETMDALNQALQSLVDTDGQ